MACHCNEFSRAHLLRSAAAEAGHGLPRIEPGMPLPAGTGLSRRSFMLRAGLGMLSVYGASKLGLRQLQEGIAQAQGTQQPVLLTVFMDGGTDSLSVLAPTEDSRYQALRPSLRLTTQETLEFADDPALRWHPRAAALDDLHRANKLTVLPSIGYDDPDQSHFTSRHYWEVGDTNPHLQTGWLGRYLDRVGSNDNPLQGVSLDGDLSPSLATAKKPVAALSGAGNYSFWAPGVWGQVEERMLDAVGALGSARGKDPALSGARAVTSQSHRLRQQLSQFDTENGFNSPVPYPKSESDFPDQMAGLAAMLAAGLPLHCVALSAYGMYDTHSDQAEDLSSGLKLTSDTLLAFQRDLEARGLANRVLTLVWSEFGRRAEENGSDGTDHGAAGIGLLMGTRVRGNMIGEFPGLKTGLDDDGNLKATVDYRSIYCSVLEQWLGTDAEAVIPKARSFARVPLLR